MPLLSSSHPARHLQIFLTLETFAWEEEITTQFSSSVLWDPECLRVSYTSGHPNKKKVSRSCKDPMPRGTKEFHAKALSLYTPPLTNSICAEAARSVSRIHGAGGN